MRVIRNHTTAVTCQIFSTAFPSLSRGGVRFDKEAGCMNWELEVAMPLAMELSPYSLGWEMPASSPF